MFFLYKTKHNNDQSDIELTYVHVNMLSHTSQLTRHCGKHFKNVNKYATSEGVLAGAIRYQQNK